MSEAVTQNTVSITEDQYDAQLVICRDLFVKKNKDYGPSWKIMRLPSMTDQIAIKARRARTLQETGDNKVGDSEAGEFIGIFNYSVMAMILLSAMTSHTDLEELENQEILLQHFDAEVQKIRDLMAKKNHDYGEAWRDMRVSSITDLILQKIERLKKIEDNEGKVIASEGPGGSYQDMANYAMFAMILRSEGK